MKQTNISIFTRVLALMICVVVLAVSATACSLLPEINDNAGDITGNVPNDTPADTPDDPSTDDPTQDGPSTDTPSTDGPSTDDPSTDNPPVVEPPVVDPNEIYSASTSISNSELIYGALASDVVIGMDDGVGAIVPADVQVAVGATSLALSVKTVDDNDSVTLGETDTASSYDVHISGIASDNKVPMTINLGSIMAAGLGDTEIKFYHIENGTPVLMTRVETTNDFSIHNQYAYNPLTGEVSIYVSSFSVFTGVETTADTWDGGYDISWYNTTGTDFTLGSAEAFAGFRAIVDGGYHQVTTTTTETTDEETGETTTTTTTEYVWMKFTETKNEDGSVTYSFVSTRSSAIDPGYTDTFDDKTVKLGVDVDLNNKLFDPIGYNYEYLGGQVFKGVFDGQRHTVYNLYQNGWDLDPNKGKYDTYTYSTAGGGLFASIASSGAENGVYLEDTTPVTIRNLAVSGANIVFECVDMGIVVGYAQGVCEFENIIVTNSKIANYNRATGGVVGEVTKGPYGTDVNKGYSHTFKNITVDSNVIVSSLWGSFDTICGGVIGGKWGDATVKMEGVIVAAELDVFSDVTAAYQWYAYRRCGMLIGHTEQNSPKKALNAAADFLTCSNVNVYYGDWVHYNYYEFENQDLAKGRNYPWVRAEEGLNNAAFSNPRYGVPTHTVTTEVDGVSTSVTTKVSDLTAEELKEKYTDYAEITFNQLYGGGQGVYGAADHDGVKTSASYSRTIYIKQPAGNDWENIRIMYWFRAGNAGDEWTTVVDGINLIYDENLESGLYRVDLPYTVSSFQIIADGGMQSKVYTQANLDNNRIAIECDHTGGTATCSAEAVCTRCGEYYGEVNKDAHSYSTNSWQSDGTQHYRYCVYCNTKQSSTAEDCSGGTATCTSKAVCATCDNEYGAVDESNHSYNAYTYDATNHWQECEYGCGAKTAEVEHTESTEYKSADGYHWHPCITCGCHIGEAECDVNEATCQNPATCTTCNTTYGGAGAHVYEWVTTDSANHWQECIYDECTQTQNKAAHTYERQDDGTATATDYGKIVDICTVCGKSVDVGTSVLTEVLPVKDGASGIVIIMHDDGSISSAIEIDEILAKYGLVGDVAMLVGVNNSERLMDTNNLTNYDDDKYNNGVIANWRELFATGRWKLTSRTMTMQSWVQGDKSDTDYKALLEYEIVTSQQILRALFPGQRVLTFAYPRFAAERETHSLTTSAKILESLYTKTARDILAHYYISARSTNYVKVGVANTQSDYVENLGTSSYAGLDVWNFFPTFTLTDTSFAAAKERITEAASSGNILVIRLEGASETDKHTGSEYIESVANHLSGYVNDGKIWNAHYEDAILYLREAQTAKVYTQKNNDNTLTINLTDDVSLTVDGEEAYNMPLSVKVSIPTASLDWEAVKIVQNDTTSYAEVVDGSFIADIVPDGGAATVTACELAEIPADSEDTTVAPSPSTDNLNREYDFEDVNDIKMIKDSVSGGRGVDKKLYGVEVVDGQLHVYKHYGVDVTDDSTINTHVIIPSGIGTVQNPYALNISFNIRIENPAIITNDGSGYDALWKIHFSDNNPITLYLGLDTSEFASSTLNEDYQPTNTIAEKTYCMYLGDTYAHGGDDRDKVLAVGVNHKIDLAFRWVPDEETSETVFTLYVYVDGVEVDKTTDFFDVETYDFSHLNFTSQTRSYFDLYLDNVSFESCKEGAHVFDTPWTFDGTNHYNTCTVCEEEIIGTHVYECGETCITCGYNCGTPVGHSYDAWTAIGDSTTDYMAECTRCGNIITSTFKNDKGYTESYMKVTDDGKLEYVKGKHESATTGEYSRYNSHFYVNFGTYDADKITIEFDINVASALAYKTIGDAGIPNYRILQLNISDFFKPYIIADTTNNGQVWHMGYLDASGEYVTINDVSFDPNKEYKITIELYLETHAAVVKVDGGQIIKYEACADVDSISRISFEGLWRADCDIKFGAFNVTESDTVVEKTIADGMDGVDRVITGESTGTNKGTLTTKTDDNDNKYIYLARDPGLSTHFQFELSDHKNVESILFSFRIQVLEKTTTNSELRIKFAGNEATPYMASIIRTSDGFRIAQKRSAENAYADETNVFKDENGNAIIFSCDKWYTITMKLHVTCCDEFLVEWIVTDGTTTWEAYSRDFARNDHNETEPETIVKYIDFWSVGTDSQFEYHCYLDDISIRAGGASVFNNDHDPHVEDAPIWAYDETHHYKSYSCHMTGENELDNGSKYDHDTECDEKIEMAGHDTNGENGACSVCGYNSNATTTYGANR